MTAVKGRYQLSGAAASVFVLAVTATALGALTPGYSPSRDTVSRLGSTGERFALPARTSFVLYGVLVLVAATRLGCFARGKEVVLSLCIAAFGSAAVVTGLAPKDPPRHPHTLTSQIHVDATLVGGLAIITAMIVVACCGHHAATRQAAAVLAALTSLMALAFPLTSGSPVYGLAERALLLLAAGWVSSLAVEALLAGCERHATNFTA